MVSGWLWWARRWGGQAKAGCWENGWGCKGQDRGERGSAATVWAVPLWVSSCGAGTEDAALVTSMRQREWTAEKSVCSLSPAFALSPPCRSRSAKLRAAPPLPALVPVPAGPLPAVSVRLCAALGSLRSQASLESSQVSPSETAMCFLLGPEATATDLVRDSC